MGKLELLWGRLLRNGADGVKFLGSSSERHMSVIHRRVRTHHRQQATSGNTCRHSFSNGKSQTHFSLLRGTGAEGHAVAGRPVGLSVILEVVMHQVVRGDVGGCGVQSAKAQDQPPRFVEPPAAEHSVVQVVVHDHAIEEREVAGREQHG